MPIDPPTFSEPGQRIERLRQRVLKSVPEVCAQRAVLATEAYAATEGEPAVIRRAKTLRHILENITVSILEDELIIGQFAEQYRGAPVFPEMGTSWLEDELDSVLETRSQDRFVVASNTKEALCRIFPYWKGKTLHDAFKAHVPSDVRTARMAYVFTVDLHERGGLGHFIPDYRRLLKEGLAGIETRLEQHLGDCDLSDPEKLVQSYFWQAVLICLEGVRTFAERHAEEARRLAATEQRAGRRAELERIASICQHVPWLGANTFHEALQSIWFLQLIFHLETNSAAISPGRLDQILTPFLTRDLAEGRLRGDSAQELLDCFWIKFTEIIKVWDKEATYVHAGFPMVQNISIGGQNSAGEDATCLLTYMMLEAQRHVRFPQPHLTLRINAASPVELLDYAAVVLRQGGGIPQFVNDELIVKSLLHRGVGLKDARESASIGCVEFGTVGSWGRNNGGYFNFAKVLELALNNGVDRLSGVQVGPATGELEEFTSFPEIVEAYRTQLEHCVRLLAIEDNLIDMLHERMMPHVLTSAFVPDCIEKGRDVTAGGARYNWTGPLGVGTGTVADALAAIKRRVFEEKKLSLAEVKGSLAADFEGHEAARELLLKSPKYGNDDDYADSLARLITDLFFDVVERHRTWRGGTFVPGLFSLSVSLPFGWKTGATPDGRKARQPLSDGISPGHGCDWNGPTGVLKSASKLDSERVTNGSILNVKMNPLLLRTKDQIRKFSDMVRAYLVDLKGAQVQFNIVSSELLREAQHYPERHRGLIIRVTGYSAFFTELSTEVQNEIIARTEHATL